MKIRFKIVVMITSQKFNILRLPPLFFLLLFSLQSFGQGGEIIKIEKNGDSLETIKIKIVKQDGKEYEIRIDKKTSSHKGSWIESGTIIILDPNTTIGIKSATNELYITAEKEEKIVEYLISRYQEHYRIMDENNSGWLYVIKKFAGDLKTSNITGSEGGYAMNTIWRVWNNGENLNFEYIEGKVAMNFRQKIEMKDKIINFKDSTRRVLYLTETVDYLSEKNKSYLFIPDSLQKAPLTKEKNIEEFFKVELKKQRRLLKTSGSHAKKGFKMLEQGRYDDGIAEYTNAIELSEIDIDRFIQASLILTEAYHEMNAKKNIANSGFQSPKIKRNLDTWLDASLHFIKKADSISNAKYENFKNNGHKKIAKAYGHDLVLSKEYLAWAYTVKLKLNGCLENTEQNPLVLMEEARKLKDTLKTY